VARPPAVLLVDPQPQSRREIADGLNRAGLVARSVADPQQTLAGVRAMQPSLVLVHSELRDPVSARVAELLARDGGAAHLPVALLCADVSDARFVRQLRTGIVALLPKPFRAAAHAAALQSLLAELPQRSGAVSGKGEGKELAALVDHLQRTHRSGVLQVNPRGPDEGRALFAKGALKTAERQGLGGPQALQAMLGATRASWSFVEVGASAPEVVIELDPAEEEELVVGTPVEEDEFGGASEGALALPRTSAPPRPPAVAPLPQPQLRILVVDDDETLCRMFSTLFQKQDFSVTTAADGYEGYEAALAEPFDLVVADLNMPRMDGWGLLRLLREDFRTRELPVVFLSCHDDYRETLRALQSGAQAYYAKSTRLERLTEQLRGLLQPRISARAALATSPEVELEIAALGPQWVLRAIAEAAAAGVLDAKDSWASYRIGLAGGQVVNASAIAGQHAAVGEKALNAYIASRGAGGTFRRGAAPGPNNLGRPVDELLAHAAAALNVNEQRVRETLLVQAREIQVQPDLYALYSQVGPRQWLETARLFCEERLPPREVLARVDGSPLEVEEALRDLIRRGVVTLSA
jgi:CheY-like chemotaxis protein